MKRIICFFIGLLAISASNLTSLYWESEYQSFFGNVSFLNTYDYTYRPDPDWNFQHTGTINQSRNKRFNRYSRNADLVWRVTRINRPLTYSVHLDYDSGLDKARPDLEEYEITKTARKFGFDLQFSPLDSLNIETGWTYILSEELNSRYSDQSLNSNGYRNLNRLYLANNSDALAFRFDSQLELLSLDYDYTRNYGANLYLELFNPELNADISFHRNSNKIYLLYDEVDHHSRSLYRANLNFRTDLTERSSLRLGETFQVRDNRFRTRRERNFLETENRAFFVNDTDFNRFRLTIGGEHYLFSRSFKDENNNRDQEQRIFTAGLKYRYSQRDSLVYNRKLSLTRTDYRVTNSILDNDQLINENQLSLYTYLRKNILLINHFNYTNRKDYYLKTEMSANNKTSRSYNLLPSLKIGVSPYLLFSQEYHLRADYDDFHWQDIIRDRMYRKFSANYSLTTGIPNFQRTERISLNREDFFRNNDLVLSTGFIYDTNNSGLMLDSVYEVITENEYYTLQFDVFRRIERLEIYLRPRFIWSETIDNIQRYEFNHLLEFTYYRPDRFSNLNISINPTGSSINDFLWRVSATATFAL